MILLTLLHIRNGHKRCGSTPNLVQFGYYYIMHNILHKYEVYRYYTSVQESTV